VAGGASPGALIGHAAGRSLPPSVVAAVRRGVADGGAPLPEQVRRPAEHRIGMDLAAVRVHAGEHAAESARALGAQAYTVGRHIVFGAGRYDPASPAAARLLMHELTHVAQQSVTGHVQLARQEDPDAKVSLGALDSPVVTAAVTPIVGGTSWVVLREFLRGMWGGLLSAPPEQLMRIQKKADDFGVVEALKYVGGYALGIVEGLWISLKGLLESIWTLIKLPYTVLEFLTVKLPALAEKYGPRILRALSEADGLTDRLENLLAGFLAHPRDSLKQLSGLIDAIGNLALGQVRALGHAASEKLLALLEEPWFDFGRDIGKIVGQILFEVILAVASEGIATAVKSGLRIAGELTARAVAGAADLLRGIGRLFGQALEWVQGIWRRLAGQARELFEPIMDILRRLEAAIAELAGEAAAADTGVGGVRLPVPQTRAPAVLESRAVRPPGTPSGPAAGLPRAPAPGLPRAPAPGPKAPLFSLGAPRRSGAQFLLRNVAPADVKASQQGYQVYEYFASDGRCLYVGKSGGAAGAKPGTWVERGWDHIAEQPEIAEADHIRVTSALTEQEAFALEEVRIGAVRGTPGNLNRSPGEYTSRFGPDGLAANAQSAARRQTFRFETDIVPYSPSPRPR
jgi:hypothetical protein